MTNAERARELAATLRCIMVPGQDTRQQQEDALAAAFAEVGQQTRHDAIKPLKRRLKIDAEFSEPGHDRWRHHKSRAEALGEAIDAIRALSEPAAPDPREALARFFQEWFECGTPNAIAIKHGLIQIADRTSQLELTDLGRSALRLADSG